MRERVEDTPGYHFLRRKSRQMRLNIENIELGITRSVVYVCVPWRCPGCGFGQWKGSWRCSAAVGGSGLALSPLLSSCLCLLFSFPFCIITLSCCVSSESAYTLYFARVPVLLTSPSHTFLPLSSIYTHILVSCSSFPHPYSL